jgi:hypothetical protein
MGSRKKNTFQEGKESVLRWFWNVRAGGYNRIFIGKLSYFYEGIFSCYGNIIE